VVAGRPALSDEQNFDGVYSGKRVLTKGEADSTCPAEDDVSVTIHRGTLTFTNSALQNFPQPFDHSPDAQFGETYTDREGAVVQLSWSYSWIIDADVSNPPCEYHGI
jgi:hypothetical protein